MGIIIYENNEISGIVNNIQKEICDDIKSQIFIDEKKLIIIRVHLYDKEEFLLDINFLIKKDTINKFNLKREYIVKNEKEEEELNVLESITTSIAQKDLENYKYKNNISSILSSFLKHDERSY